MSDDYVRVPRAVVAKLLDAQDRLDALERQATKLLHVVGRTKEFNRVYAQAESVEKEVGAAEFEVAEAALKALRAGKEGGT